MSESKISKSLDYSKNDVVSPAYRMSKITAREGAGDVTVTTAGGQSSTFELPSRAMNLSKSVLAFTCTPPASGAGESNYSYMDCLAPIRQVQLQSRSGVYLCDCNEVGAITKMTWKPETKLCDFLALENHDGGSGAGSMLQKCNANNQLAFSQTAAEFKAAVIDTNGSLADLATDLTALITRPATNARRHDDVALAAGTGEPSSVSVAFQEAKYFSVGGANSATPAIQVKLDLGMLYNTIFEVDKTIMLPEIVNLIIVWAPSTKVYYHGDDPLSPGGGVLTAAAGNVTVSGLNLFLAVETREEIIQSLRAKIASPEGMGMLIPYPYVYKNNLSSTQQNIVLKFDRGHGLRLQKIYHSLFHNTESKNTAYDCDNRADAKVSSFYSSLDSIRQQEFNIDTSVFEDYMLMKPKLAGSAVLNSDVYQYNWVWCDAFDNDRPLWDKNPNEASGLDLSQERRYEIACTTSNNNFNHVTLVVCQRELRIKSNSIEIR